MTEQVAKNSMLRSISSTLDKHGNFDEHSAAVLVIQPLLAMLKELHGKGIIHGDVHPSSIFLDADNKLRLMDCGSAASAGKAVSPRLAGTLDYVAPEMHLPNAVSQEELSCPDQHDAAHRTSAVDIWGVGVLAYQLLLGRPPFKLEHEQVSQASYEDLMQADLQLPEWLSSDAHRFLRSALCKDGSMRPTARQLLKHSWLQPAQAFQPGTFNVRRTRTTSCLNLGSVAEEGGSDSGPGHSRLRPSMSRRPSCFMNAMSTLASARSYRGISCMGRRASGSSESSLWLEAEPASTSSPVKPCMPDPAQQHWHGRSGRPGVLSLQPAAVDAAQHGSRWMSNNSSGDSSPAAQPPPGPQLASGGRPRPCRTWSERTLTALNGGGRSCHVAADGYGDGVSAGDPSAGMHAPTRFQAGGVQATHAADLSSDSAADDASGSLLSLGRAGPSRRDSWPVLIAGLEARQDALTQLMNVKSRVSSSSSSVALKLRRASVGVVGDVKKHA